MESGHLFHHETPNLWFTAKVVYPQTQQESHQNNLRLSKNHIRNTYSCGWRKKIWVTFLQSTWVPTPSLPSACHSMCTIKYVEHDPNVVLILGIHHFMHEFLFGAHVGRECVVKIVWWSFLIEGGGGRGGYWKPMAQNLLVNVYMYASTNIFL